MDNGEATTNQNAVVSFHGMDTAHKRALFADRSDFAGDSGFAENWSISHSSVAASTSGLSNSAKLSSSSFRKSNDLEPISENNELSGLQETPTTRSIRHLDAFHINTPQNVQNQMETTPKKANYFSNVYGSGSNGSQNSIQWSINKSSPRLRSQRKSFSARSTLFESIDENYEKTFNDDAVNPCDQSIGVSPIKVHNNSVAKQPEKLVSLPRHPSGIDSSTPKNSFKRTRTQSIVKTKASLADELIRSRLIRKTQSFSPSKRLALRERFQQNVIENVEDERFEAVKQSDTNNPARKVLDFTPKKFGQLVNVKQHHNIPEPPTVDKWHQNEAETSTKATSTKCLPLKRLDTHRSNSRLVKEFTRKITMRHIQPTLMENHKAGTESLNESDILMALATARDQNETDSQKCDRGSVAVDSIVMSTMTTPSTNCKSQAMFSSDTPNRSDFMKKNICEQANRTPSKRFEKSTSYGFASAIKSSPEKEKFEIVYGHLQCTPPKKYPRRQLKRPAANRADSPAANAPSAKRRLYEICERPSYFNGFEQLDILSYLKKFKMFHLVDHILAYLPDESLQTVHSVCKTWKSLVDGNDEFCERRRRFVRTMKSIKENVHHNEIKPVINNNNNVKPMHEHNVNVSNVGKSIVVSPSTQRFNEHQCIIKSLKPEQRVIHCPRCNGTSIVHPATATEAKVQRRSPRRQTNSILIYQDRSLRSSTGSATKNRPNNIIGKVVLSEYAVCSKKLCGFEFCTNCNGNRHVNGKCTKRPLGSSPKSDEDSPYQAENRTMAKHPLRRLRRLVF